MNKLQNQYHTMRSSFDNKLLIIFLMAALLLSSCAPKKQFVYLRDMQEGETYPVNMNIEPQVKTDDRLSIIVSSKKPELAIPFNINGGNFRVSTDGNITSTAPSKDENGYRVDKNGDIDFPILGKLHVEGLTVTGVKEMIRRKIIDGDYIKDPIVSVEFLNFKYSVLGAVANNGSFSAEGDQITLLEAIAKAGDLNEKARIDRVAVIRKTDKGQQIFWHDLGSTSIFSSPCFYLQQNDIIYVEPKYKKKNAEDRTVQYISLGASVATAASTFILMMYNTGQLGNK